jgi:hypothetical protein
MLKIKVKEKLKMSLCFKWAPRHEGILGEWRFNSTHSLTSALDEGELSASHPGRFTPREKVPWHPLDRRLGGPQSRSGRSGEEKNSQPLPGLEPPIKIRQNESAEVSIWTEEMNGKY